MKITKNTVDMLSNSGYLPKDGLVNLDKTVTSVVKLLLLHGITIAAAESCTGGLISQLLTSVPGVSEIFSLGMCTYSNETKHRYLHVPQKTLKQYGAVSAQTAIYMARGIQSAAGADIGVSVTGIAGPGGGTSAKPVGTVFAGFAFENRAYAVLLPLNRLEYLKSREDIRRAAALCVFEQLFAQLNEE